MISAKIQIDCLLRSSKIVVFLNNVLRSDSKVTKTARTVTTVNTAGLSIDDSIKLSIRSSNYTSSSALLLEYPKLDDLNKKSVSNKSNLDVVSLFELYGIPKEHITILSIEQLKNYRECELYLKKYYCNDQDIKYPLVFIHGIFLGSDSEINLAHNEGFLFELFRDTGLFNSPENLLSEDHENEDDYDDEETNIIDDDYDGDDDDEDIFAIDKVAKINSINNSPIKNKIVKKRYSELTLKSTNISVNNVSGSSSSLNSLNKNSYCQNYVNKTFNSIEDNPINTKTPNLQLSAVINKENVSAEPRLSQSKIKTKSAEIKRFSDPGEVLATINKWLKKTKDVIETRNKQIINKNNL